MRNMGQTGGGRGSCQYGTASKRRAQAYGPLLSLDRIFINMHRSRDTSPDKPR
jgi:hypothetical protein